MRINRIEEFLSPTNTPDESVIHASLIEQDETMALIEAGAAYTLVCLACGDTKHSCGDGSHEHNIICIGVCPPCSAKE